MGGRRYTKREIAAARKLSAQGRTRSVAGLLIGRTRWGLSYLRRRGLIPLVNGPKVAADRRSRVAELHAEGFNDREIAATLRCASATVWNARAKLGLPAVGLTQRSRDTMSRRCQGQTHAKEYRNGQRRAVAAQGWPAGCNPALARVLAALERIGPATARQIAPAVTPPMRPRSCYLHLRTAHAEGWVTKRRGRETTFALTDSVRDKRDRANLRSED